MDYATCLLEWLPSKSVKYAFEQDQTDNMALGQTLATIVSFVLLRHMRAEGRVILQLAQAYRTGIQRALVIVKQSVMPRSHHPQQWLTWREGIWQSAAGEGW